MRAMLYWGLCCLEGVERESEHSCAYFLCGEERLLFLICHLFWKHKAYAAPKDHDLWKVFKSLPHRAKDSPDYLACLFISEPWTQK